MGDQHITRQHVPQEHVPLYQHHNDSFKQLDSIYRTNMESHESFMSEYDTEQKDSVSKTRDGASLQQTSWGKTYVSKLKDKEQRMTQSDRERLKSKERLREIVELDKINLDLRLGKLPDDFKALLNDIIALTQINATAIEGDYEEEQKKTDEIRQKLDTYIGSLLQKAQPLNQKDTRLLERAQQYKTYFVNEQDGQLTLAVTDTVSSFEDDQIECEYAYKDKKKQALFPHDPSMNDISQGYLGDCYLLAGLSSIVSTQPMKIKESMRDNGDGSVTVRFFRKEDDSSYSPIYIKVQKTAPNEYSSDCLWVQMIEKAYAASQLHRCNIKKYGDPEHDAIPIYKNNAAIQAEYDDFARMTEEQINAINADPAFSDEEKRLSIVPLQENLEIEAQKLSDIKGRSYKDIAAGITGDFIEILLGEQHKSRYIPYKTRQFNNEDTIGTQLTELRGATMIDTISKTVLRTKHGFDTVPDPSDVAASTDYLNKQISTVMRVNSLTGKIDDAVKEKVKNLKNATYNLRKITLATLDEYVAKFKADRGGVINPVDEAIFAEIRATYNAVIPDKISRRIQEPLSGEYNAAQLNEYAMIERELLSGNIITAGTKKMGDEKVGLNGETRGGGVYGSHAYSVLGVETRMIKGKEFRFIKLRNPWGHGIEQYTMTIGSTLTARRQDKGGSGVFLVELGRFLNVYADLHIN